MDDTNMGLGWDCGTAGIGVELEIGVELMIRVSSENRSGFGNRA